MVMMLSLKPPIVYPSTRGAACGGGLVPRREPACSRTPEKKYF
jgi:hypothetical protein